jgi:Response regulator containing CheY-like receiver domain and AraC-type DNA-binding domain
MGRLLLVDDEVYAIEGVKAAFDWKSIGIDEIFTAFNASQARDVLSRVAIDVALCDIEMPEESGLDLLAWINSKGYATKVIFLTCHSDFGYARETVKLHGFDYLVKPVPADELRSAVSAALSSSPGSQGRGSPAQSPRCDGLTPPLAGDGCSPSAVSIPDMSRWTILLKSDGIEQVRYELRSYLERLPPKTKSDREFLQRFLVDFQQVVFSVLRARGVSAHALLSSDEASRLYQDATSSLSGLLLWADVALDSLKARFDEADVSHSHFGRAAGFIAKNLTEELSCEKIAAHVGLNPDYLTRLFKKESGLSVSAYIIREKMRFAADLLVSTSLPIGEISDRIGYVNPAHFSAAFKKFSQMSPIEYRAGYARSSVVAGVPS